MVRKKYTDEEVEFVKNHIVGRKVNEVAELGKPIFGDGFTSAKVTKIKDSNKFISGTRRTVFTQEEKEFVLDNIKNRTWQEMCDMFNTQFNKEYRVENFMHHMTKIGITKGKSTTEVPIGTEINDGKHTGGILIKYRKIDPKNNIYATDTWMQKNRYVWEKFHGRELPKGHVIIFKDGDKSNFEPSNLIAIERGMFMFIIRKGLKYSSAEELILIKGMYELSKAMKHAKAKLKGANY